MAKDNESTLKFKADISNLKQGISEANRQIKLANTAFEAAASAMGDWSSSTEGLRNKITQLESVYDSETRKLELLRQQYELTAQEYGENSREAENLQIKINQQQATINNVSRDLETYRSRLHNLGTAANEAQNSVGNSGGAFAQLTDKIKEQENQLAELKNRYKEYVFSGDQASDEAQDLANQIRNLSTELNNNRQQMQNADNAADELTDSLDDVGEGSGSAVGGIDAFKIALGNLISQGIQKAIAAIKEFVKESIEIGKNFDSQMSKVGAISGATGEELEALTEKAKEMGSTTKFTATEAGQAFEYMAMAGWKAEDMLNGIEGIMALTAATGENLATVSDIVTDALTGFGYTAADTNRFVDVLAATATNANTDVGKMGETFKYLAPVAGAFGYSVEDVGVSIGLMANAEIKASDAGTALRSIITRLSTDAGASSKSLGALGTLTEKLGVEFYNADGSARNFNDVINDAREAWQGLTMEEQANYAKKIAGQNAISGWLALMNASTDDVEKLEDALYNCDGAADAMAETMLDNLGGDMTLLDSKIEGIQLALYKKFEPALRAGVAALDKFADGLSWFIENGSPIIGVITSLGTAVGAFMIYLKREAIVTAFTAAINGVKAAFVGLNATMAANPIGLVIAAISALVAAFIYFWNTSEEFRNFWIGLWDNIQKVTRKYIDAIVGFFTGIWDGIKSGAESAGKFFSDVWGGISGFFEKIWKNITDAASKAWEAIKKVFSPVAEFYKKIFKAIFEFYKSYIELIIGLAKGCWQIIKRVFEVVGDWFNKNIFKPVGGAFKKMWDGISSAAGAVWNAIKEAFGAASAWFKDKIITPVGDFFAGMWENLKKGAADAWEGITSVFSVVVDWFKDNFSKAWEAVRNVFSTGGKIFDGIKDGIVSTFKTIVNGIIEAMNKVISIPFNKINELLNGIRNISILDIRPFEDLWDENPLAIPQIPQLARGGVLRRGQMALLEGQGAEAIVPLEKNTGWIKSVAREMAGTLSELISENKKSISESSGIIYAINDTNDILRNTQTQIFDFYAGMNRDTGMIIQSINNKQLIVDVNSLANKLTVPMNTSFGRLIAQRGRT